MRIVRGTAIVLSMCATVGVGCRRQEPAAEPDDLPVAEASSTLVELTDGQKAAIDAITAAGGEIDLDGSGLPVRIDLATERTFADESLVRAVLLFPELKSLRLTLNSVPETTLAELAALTQLEELFLQDGAIDDASFRDVLTAMPNVRRLTLRRINGVTDESFSAVSDCPNLEVVALIEMNELTGAGLEPFAKLQRLRALDLRNCGRLTPEDLKRLAAFSNLSELKLGGPAINDQIADLIVSLPNVTSLAVEDAEISAAFIERLASDKATADRLRMLAFARCFGVTDDALLSIDKFTNLEALSLRDIMVSGEFLTSLSKVDKGPLPLRSLTATNAFVDDAVIQCLPTLAPNLERLDLRGNPGITDESKQVFVKLQNLSEIKRD